MRFPTLLLVTLALILAAACSSGDGDLFNAGEAASFAPDSVTTFARGESGELVRTSAVTNVVLVFHLVRLGGGEFLALYPIDPHRGCPVSWRPDFEWEGRTGWFRNPCHGELYFIDGMRAFGPSPRDLDRSPIAVVDGRVIVTTSLDALILGEQRSEPSADATAEPSPAEK